jgi:hypothetical protein
MLSDDAAHLSVMQRERQHEAKRNGSRHPGCDDGIKRAHN